MSQLASIALKEVGYRINNKVILEGISLEIFSKEVISVIGYNGAGKSTLLNMLLGSITPSHGTITKKAGLKMGFVPQKLSFDRKLPLTVQDFLSIYNTKEQLKHPLLAGALKINELLGTPLSGLSGGQLQKVLIYNALLGNPDILLLDEPTAGLDISAQKEFYALLEAIHKKIACTIIMVSHDIHTVYNKSDKVICLHRGHCCMGKPHDKKLTADMQDLLGSYISPYIHHHPHD